MDPVVTLTEDELVVEPGGDVTTTVRVRNASTVVEEYDLSVLGDVAAYAEVIPPRISVFVGEVAEATVIIRPPYDTMISSGQIPFAIRAQSLEDGERVDLAEGELTVGAINLVQTTLVPTRLAGRLRAKARIEVHNRGTEEARVRLRTVDPDGKLSFALAPREIDVPPNGTVESFLKARPRKNIIMGKPAHHAFQVSYRRKAGARDAFAGATSGGETEAFVDSSFEQKPIVAKWMLGLVALVMLIGTLVVVRAQTADISVAVANPVRAPQPPTALTIDSSVDELRISWEPPNPAPSGYTVLSADPELYAEGVFDILEDLDPLGPQERSFPLDVAGGTAKCLFVQSFIDDPEIGRTNSVIVGLASPNGLVTSGELPAGNCVTAEQAVQCPPPVIAEPVITSDPDFWLVEWTYGDGCDDRDEAVWTIFVNDIENVSPDGPDARQANVDLSAEAVAGEYRIRVSPGEGETGTTFVLSAPAVEAEKARVEAEIAQGDLDGRAPVGSYAIVTRLVPASHLPLAEPPTGSLSEFMGQIQGAITLDTGPLAIDEGRVWVGPVDEGVELGPGMALLRLTDFEPDLRFYYMYVDGFPDRAAAFQFCGSVDSLVASITEGDEWRTAFPLINPPPPCEAIAN